MNKSKTIKALCNTFLKLEPKQSSELSDKEKQLVKKGYVTQVTAWTEFDAKQALGGHVWVELDHNAGDRYIYAPHWEMPWHNQGKPDSTVNLIIDWSNPSAQVSSFFTVAEVTLLDSRRTPLDPIIKKNVLTIAETLDEVRRWWNSPLRVTSWYRPAKINATVGGARNSHHIGGGAVDFYPMNGSVNDLQNRFEEEWYKTGKWNGGFGRGAKKGFIHLDIGPKRMWDY